ncbi:MAG: hypothetical protein GF308_06320 [Candidatus Heimdallarchaeota archaeon]|nr:hypothetical protein [Candidatus Heimdallarchaeota archaeon]
MLHYLMLVHRETGGLLFEKRLSKTFNDLPAELLSNMMIALNDFSKMMKIGDLSNFISLEFKVIISAIEKVSIVIVMDKNDSEEIGKKIALEIGEAFSKQYDLSSIVHPVNEFTQFETEIKAILSKLIWEKRFDAKIEDESIIALLFFDLHDMVYSRLYSNSNIDDQALIEKTLKVTDDDITEVTLVEKDRVVQLLRYESFGGVLLTHPEAPKRDLDRLQKTVSFLIKYLDCQFTIKEGLEKAALSLFPKEVIAKIQSHSHKSLQNILIETKNLNLIEDIRRLKLRELVNITRS